MLITTICKKLSRRTTCYNDDLKSSKFASHSLTKTICNKFVWNNNFPKFYPKQQFAKKNCVEKVFAKFGKKLFITTVSKDDPLQQFEKYCLEQHFATNWPGKQFA